MFFEHADAALKQMASKWQRLQSDYRERIESGGVYNAFRDLVK
jgi:hypothetical protein